MLETLLRAALVNVQCSEIEVSSAGTGAAVGEPASVGAQRAMQRRGLSLADHRSRPLRSLALDRFDQFWCMTPAHAQVLRQLGAPDAAIHVVNAAGGGVPDPFGGDDEDYEACATVLELAARDLADLFSART
jgi:protein-tyrosine-phosphatase